MFNFYFFPFLQLFIKKSIKTNNDRT